jgi:CRP/FNR family cyclic AMP-dependent transcriptional regulator
MLAEPEPSRRIRMDVAAALKQLDLFEDLTEPALRSIAAAGERVTLAAGEVVVVEGGPSDALYVVLSGSCRVFKETGGDARPVVVLGPGSQFGASALVEDGASRSATVVTLEPTELVAFRAERLKATLDADPAAAAKFYRALAASVFARLRKTTDDLGFARMAAEDRRR